MATRSHDAVPHSAFRDAVALHPGRGGWPWRPLAFYVGVPLFFSIYAALNNWQLIDALGLPATLLFYVAHAFVPWLGTALLCQLAMQLLRQWQPPPWVIMMSGNLVGCLLATPYTMWLARVPWFELAGTADDLSESWRVGAYFMRATAVWLAVNYFFDRFLGYPRYRYTGPVQLPEGSAGAPTPATEPPFMQRMTKGARAAELIALKAEQHYIQVITDRGSELVLYRLGDAIRELPRDCGVQVHRSWWISRSAVEAIHTHGKKMTMQLRNGLRVPVSGPYRALAKSVRENSAGKNAPAGADADV